jgi:hypothetical protein
VGGGGLKLHVVEREMQRALRLFFCMAPPNVICSGAGK